MLRALYYYLRLQPILLCFFFIRERYALFLHILVIYLFNMDHPNEYPHQNHPLDQNRAHNLWRNCYPPPLDLDGPQFEALNNALAFTIADGEVALFFQVLHLLI